MALNLGGLYSGGGQLLPGNRADDPYNIQKRLSDQTERIYTGREYQSYGERVSEDFSNIWDTISEDISRTAQDTGGSPLQGLFTPAKGPVFSGNLTDTQFYGKTLPTALGTGTRGVLSPLSSLFSGFSTGQEEIDKGLFSEGLSSLGDLFEGAQSGVSTIGQRVGLEERYAGLASEGIVNIATGEIGEAGLAKIFKGSKLKSIDNKKIEYGKTIYDELDTYDIPKSFLIKQNAVKRAQQLFDTFNTKVEEGVLTKQEYIDTKRELTSLGIKDTNYFTERWNDQFSSSKIKDIATEQTLSEVDGLITKSKILEWYNSPEKAPSPRITKILSDVRKLEDAGYFKIGGINTFHTQSPKKTAKIRKLFNGEDNVDGLIDLATGFRNNLFKDTPEQLLSQLYVDNEAKKTLGKLGLDSDENPFKRETLINLLDRGIIREDIKDSKLYSYKLTSEGAKVSKKLGFSDEQIANAKTKGFAEHTIEDIDKFREEQFTFPDVINNTDLTLANTLKNTEGVEFVGFRKIVNRLNKANNLGFDSLIAEAKTVKDLIKITDKINTKASDLLINSEGFKPFKIKGIAPTSFLFKNMPEDIVNRVVEKTNFALEKNRITDIFNKRIVALKKAYKNNLEKLSLATKNALDSKDKLLLQVRLKYKQFGEIKSERIKELRKIASNGNLLGNIDGAISKVVKNKEWNTATTIEQLKKQLEKLDKAIALEHTKGLQQKITKELKKVVLVNKGTSKSYRMGHTPEIEELLLRMKEIWKANKSGYINIDQLNSLLSDIKEIKSESRRVARQFEIERANLIEGNISKIKEEGIQNTYGSSDLDRVVSSKEKLKALIGDWKNVSTFMYNTFGEIFGHTADGKMSKGVEIFSANPSRAINQLNNWMEKKAKPLADLIVNKLGDEQDDWGTAMIARQIDNTKSNPYIGFDRIENSPSLKKIYYVDRISPIKEKPSWVSDEIWDKIKNKKLGEIVERMEVDKDWLEVKEEWNDYHDELWGRYDSVVKQFDGIKLSKRQDYFTLVTEQGVKDFQFNEQDTLGRSYIANRSANETVSTTKGAGIDYSPNPINVLLYGDRPTVLQTFLREPFEEMVQTYLGKQRKFASLSNEERIQLLSLTDENGDFIHKITDKYGKPLADKVIKNAEDLDDFIATSDLNIDDIYITDLGGGIRKDMNNSTSGLINDYIKKFARGGTVQTNGTERVIAGVVNQVGANTLAFSPSSIAQQPLSLFHAMAIMGTRKTLRNLKDVFNDPELIIKAEKASPAVRNRKGDNFMFAEILEKTYENNALGKIKEVLRKYNEIGLYPMRIVDEKVYASIWIGAYREWMQKNGFTFTGEFIKEDGIKYADLMTDKIAGTTNKINVPPLFNNLFGQTLFKLASTKINEWQTIKFHTLDAFKKGNTERGFKTIGIYTASNLAQAGIVYGVAKALYGMGLTSFDPDKNGNLIEQIVSLEGAYDLTVGNTPIGMKIGGVTNFGTLSIMDSLSDKIGKSLKEIKSGEEMQGVIDFIQIFIGGKPIGYTEELLK